MSMRVLVTGANGKTGRAVVAAIANRGATVRAFIRKAEQAESLKKLGAAEFAVGDMNKPETMGPAMKDCKAVVHIGPPMHPDEKDMTRHLVDAADTPGVARFVYYSVLQPLRRVLGREPNRFPQYVRRLAKRDGLL